MSKVVVTGLGFITSIGNSRDEVQSSLENLRSGIEWYPGFDDPKIPIHVLGTIKDFDTASMDQEDWTFPSQYRINRSFLRSLSPHVLYGYCAMKDAIEDAGLQTEDISNPDTGMFTASAGSTSSLVYHVNHLREYGAERSQPKAIVASIAGTMNFNLASHFHIRGATCGYVSACASSGHALAAAFEEIQSGRQKRMVVVGAEDGNTECILPFASMRALSLNPDPATASRPFDRDHDGFVGTGGGVAMVLEAEDVAVSRGASIYGRMIGYGQASDGFSAVLPQPEGDGLIRAIEMALKRAEIEVSDVDYINAHAPSTPMGDIAEIKALRKVFAEKGVSPMVSSTKALTGHALSMASVLEAAISVLSLKKGFVPGSANFVNPEKGAEDLNIIPTTEKREIQRLITNSSGFGGANVSLVFERA
ncbi:beta-ketoacyl-[acyl-carrier-protein] synthase family protein [Puniceicoccus vermicola]|uniref:3-oxoacyl-[acyl-carrier-protein] synthase 1 n=1 Tax=Puniceicoccus vermicola TaxID=388746 RepID=A0A7X1AY44_9BACT|nr:beta-ketoacyl-[acyl-carrier-protein] synthase family protein [Puniceicoccus vermicola]MBC2602097.1 beta-ketoacyl-[acyl-carrier-protein] synthase family protein [Puniceicoccus vermicola]